MTATQFAITSVLTVFGSVGFWQLIQHILDRKSIIREMVLGLAYDRLLHLCEKYLDRGWIETDELADLNRYLYEPYRKLGGNGTAEKLMKKVENLPNKKGE